jgi:cell division protein ZipA
MTWLRVLLFLLAVAGCVAAYFWGVQPRRRNNRLIRSPSWRRSNSEKFDLGEIVMPAADDDRPPDPDDRQDQLLEPVDSRRRDSVRSAGVAEAGIADVTAAPDHEVTPESVIALHITAKDGATFCGTDIRAAAEAVGLRYGAMGVFHHYGVGQLQSGDSLFCLANMFEPGSFDLNDLAVCRTRGLVLLMQLPLPLDGKVAFELLLSSAHRLVKKLDGDLSDDRRQPLTPASVNRLRALASAGGAMIAG